jgi:hypothetical protein
MSNKQDMIDGLLAFGYEEQKPLSKYRVFLKPGSDQKLLIGKSGALRMTRSTVANSRSWTGGKYAKAYAYVGQLSRKLDMTYDIAHRAFNDHIDGKIDGR